MIIIKVRIAVTRRVFLKNTIANEVGDPEPMTLMNIGNEAIL
jgi:hypothetical protein